MTGFASGTINAMIHDDPSLALKGAAGGALSGCVRTVAHKAVELYRKAANQGDEFAIERLKAFGLM